MHVEDGPGNGSMVCHFLKDTVVCCLPTCYARCPDSPADWWCEGSKIQQ